MSASNRRAAFWVLAMVVAGGAYWPGRSIDVATQRTLYDSLQNAAGIIFLVMGIWIALLYPEARDRVLKLRSASSPEEERVNRMLQPLMIATAVLGVTLFFGPVAEAAKTFSTLHLIYLPLRGASFVVLLLSMFSLFWSVLMTLLPVSWVQRELAAARRKQDKLARMETNLRNSA